MLQFISIIFYLTLIILFKVFIISLPRWASCTTAGLSFMDKYIKPYRASYINDNDPCNPLYWYPKNIPESCFPKGPKDDEGAPKPPVPLPIPVPMPMPIPPPVFRLPIVPPPPVAPPLMPPLPPIPPPYMLPQVPPSFGMPIAPSPMFPGPGIPIPYYPPPYPIPPMYGQKQVGMVPGLPGLVTPDGGINILPFSDAYSDLLEKHKAKAFRKRFRHLYDKYDKYPRGEYRRHRKHRFRQY